MPTISGRQCFAPLGYLYCNFLKNLFLRDLLIKTPRFLLRPLCVADVTDKYFGWIQDTVVQRFIVTASLQGSLEDLRVYVAEREMREDVLFLGIYTSSGEHIGNLKYEPMDVKLGIAVMGILIGEKSWRGKGVAYEVISASAMWLKLNKNIKRIELGVNIHNQSAIAVYKKLGFIEIKVDSNSNNFSQVISMIWDI